MYYVSEQAIIDLVNQAPVTEAVGRAFAALASGKAECWPVVRETLDYQDAIFGFKSGFDRRGPTLGVKAGGLWPGNAARGVPNHQSTVMLFDADSGAPHALIRATYLTALRTAAISALSIRHLARRDAHTIGIIGAGGQGLHQLLAALPERAFERVLIFDVNETAAGTLAERIGEQRVTAEVADPEMLVRASDVLITITPSRQAIVKADWVQPGTHIAAMGSDTIGKQELESVLASRARVFGDLADQSVSLGEMQHAFADGLIKEADIAPFGAVLNGEHPGRANDEEITIFDSTGIALQDLAACEVALQAAINADRAVELD